MWQGWIARLWSQVSSQHLPAGLLAVGGSTGGEKKDAGGQKPGSGAGGGRKISGGFFSSLGSGAVVVAAFAMLSGLLLLSYVLLTYNRTIALPAHPLLTRLMMARLSFNNQAPTDGPYVCMSNCFYWNPAVVFHRGHHLIAVRESTKSHCGGLKILQTAGVLLFRSAFNSVLVGTVDEFTPGVTEATLSWRVPNGQLPGDGKAHFGFEDPRWVVQGDDLFLLVHREMRDRPTVFLARVLQVEPSLELGPCVHLKSVHGDGWPEKNWMHIPHQAPGDARLLFVNSLDPLEILATDPSTGKSSMVYAQNGTGRAYWGHRLSGSTPFIATSGLLLAGDERAAFFGLAHARQDHPLFGFGFGAYVLYLARIALLDDGSWRLTVGDMFNLPTDESDASKRINFPTTVIETPERPGEFLVSLGEMDCTSHVVSLEKSGVLSLVNNMRQQVY
ncbi:hypothetical protein FOA52_002518 [Chlamydomonas sp. UWO 241]|nr:hypothetical protein FOA52_002518 [Chlamydomonas sp. UWO 241]